MTDELTIKIKGSSWARVTRELDEARRDLKLATYDATQETIKVSKTKSAWIEACRERDEARRIACFMMTRSESSIEAAKAFGWDCFKEDRA